MASTDANFTHSDRLEKPLTQNSYIHAEEVRRVRPKGLELWRDMIGYDHVAAGGAPGGMFAGDRKPGIEPKWQCQ